MDAHHADRVSQTYLMRLSVSQAHECIISIRNTQLSSSGKHKFKVGGCEGGGVRVCMRGVGSEWVW